MKFSIKKAFKDSWKMFVSKKLYLSFVLTSLVAVIGLYVTFGVSGLVGTFFLMRGLWWVLIPLLLVFLFIATYFILVNINLSLTTYKTGEIHFKKVFSSVWNSKLIIKSVGLLLLVGGGALVVGYLLSWLVSKINPVLAVVVFAIWVAFVAVRFAFSLYILIDLKETIIKSIKKSHAMMKGNGWKFLLFIIAVSVISLAVQLISNKIGLVSPMLSEIVIVLFGITIAPWFSLLTVSPYMQLKAH
jgi:hypothetical protein